VLPSSGEQAGGSEEAADMVGAKRWIVCGHRDLISGQSALKADYLLLADRLQNTFDSGENSAFRGNCLGLAQWSV
jgi:hypothetical protein